MKLSRTFKTSNEAKKAYSAGAVLYILDEVGHRVIGGPLFVASSNWDWRLTAWTDSKGRVTKLK